MQYTLKLGLEKAAQTTVLQDSKDSDSVCLALLRVVGGAMERAHNVIVQMEHKPFCIKRLRSPIEIANIRPFSIAILYCLSGNDFNPACADAAEQWY